MANAGPAACATLALLALAAACGAPAPVAQDPPPRPEADLPGAPPGAPDPEGAPLRRALELPAGWATLPAVEFEAAVERWNPDGAPGALLPDGLAALARSLAAPDESAVRAAVLLAHAHDPAATDALAGFLERRARVTGAAHAAAVVAAAALADPPPEARGRVARRLAELGSGERPHPVFDVRVECAASALALGRTEVVAFLLEVLREGTSAQTARPAWRRGSVPQAEIEWSQARAALALAARAGVPCTYRPEASAQERAEAAAALAQLLAADRKTTARRPSFQG